jgi:hypothetical protein
VIVLLILLAAVAGYFLFVRDETPDPAPVANVEPASLPAPEPPQPIQPAPPAEPEPVPEPEPPRALNPIDPLSPELPLPELGASDEPFRLALGEVTGRTGLTQVLSEELIYHIVATVDNLPRKYLPASIVPLRRAEGAFIVEGKEGSLAIGARNAKRYGLYTAAAKSIDSARLVELYRRYYPLFQRAYQELGYPQAHFNDRLVVAIDDLLAAPEPPAPIRLAQPKILYEYADPKLENRSAGQKIMMRIGRENAAVLKSKLLDIRARIARQEADPTPPATGNRG